MAKAHKETLFEKQIPVIPLRNCESKFGFQRGNIRYYSNNHVSNSGMWQSISSIKYAMNTAKTDGITCPAAFNGN